MKYMPTRRWPTAQKTAAAPVTVRYVCPLCGGGHSRADHDDRPGRPVLLNGERAA